MNKRLKLSFIILTLIIIAFTALTACSSPGPGQNPSSGENGNQDDERVYQPRYLASEKSGYHAIYNDVSGFWIDIPESWKAAAEDENSDGFYLIPDSGKTDIRVYGVADPGNPDEYVPMLAGENGLISEFIFVDGVAGNKIENKNETVYYVRPDGDSFICLYVNYKNNREWFEKNTDVVEETARSIRTKRSIHGEESNGEDKITMDDLALGIFTINMLYSDLNKYMAAESVREEALDTGGKLLFYEDGTEVFIFEDRLHSMNVISSEYETPRGVKVGDSAEKVKELYGKPDNISEDGLWGYTIDGYELLTFMIEDGKVSQIQIDMSM